MKLQDSLLPNIRILKAIGLWPAQSPYQAHYKCYSAFMITSFMLCYNSALFVNICLTFPDIEQMAACAFIFLITLAGQIKTYYFLKDFHLIESLMEGLNCGEFIPKNQRQENIVRLLLGYWKMTYYTFLVMTSITCCFWFAYPFLDGTVHQNRLPFAAWFPYDYKATPGYEISYVYECLCSIYISCINVSLDGFLSGLMVHVAAQCDTLKDSLANMSGSQLKSTTSGDGGACRNGLVQCILHHKMILRFADKVQQVLNIIALFQFVCSLVMICMTLLHLTLVAPFSSEFFTLVIYLMCVFIQLLTYCWYGDEIFVKSSEIPGVAFECEWLDQSVEFKKNLVFFIRRTQKPIQIFAVDFFTLSIPTFTKIVRMSWSYFILLRQLHNQQH